ncbi:MAG: AAA family ATPase [Sandaracinaceae bacterium]|nr:AAA family ATPase [Sandaracinaceae bacterium]
MSFSISVYQRKREGLLEWTTLGLGARTVSRIGASPTRLQQQVADDLRKHLREMKPLELRAFELVRGRRLVRVRLELSLAGSRERAAGIFPLVLEPRATGSRSTITIAYHPLRPSDWLVVPDEALLAEGARPALARAWRDLSKSHVEGELTSDGKDVLKILSFVERPPALIDELPPDEDEVWADLEIDTERERGGKKKKKRRKQAYGRKTLRQVGANVSVRAADGLLRAGRPREPWRSQLAQLLAGPRKTPVVLVGPPGVGKTTLLHRLALDLLEHDDYPSHRNLDRVHELWRVSSRQILAGMSFIGDWERRVVELVAEARDPRVILWIEDIAALGRAGRTRDSDRVLSDVLRGPLARGEITIVGEATRSAWQKLEEDAPAFADLFTALVVEPTAGSDTFSLLLHEARELEAQHRVRFEPEAYRTMVSLGATLSPSTAQPGVSVDLLRRLAADASFASADADPVSITSDDVVRFLAKRTGLPQFILRPDSELESAELERSFEAHVMGQPEAVRTAVDLVARIRAGLTDPRRPYGTYLFTGPTGTGKTQLSKAIAGFLYGDAARLVRFDMGELSGPDAVSRLIGDRFQPRGLLTEAVRQQPFCVVLLDEIEKAHGSVLHLLLSLLDEGRLTDAAGDDVDFTHTVIVMTSNLGARARPALGFGEDAGAVARDVERAVREHFPPEVFNRIDRIVSFHPLTPEIAERVTEKELASLLARKGLSDRNVFVYAHPDAVRRMARVAFDERGGARSVQRWLESTIGTLLADELARGGTDAMRIVRVYGGGELGYRLHVEALEEAEPHAARYELAEWLSAPVSELRPRLGELRERLASLRRSEAFQAIEAKIASLLDPGADPAARRALYWLDAYRSALGSLEERLHAQRDLGAQAVRARMGSTTRTRSGPGVRPFDREQIWGALAEVAALEGTIGSVERLETHRVLVEIARVGQGRRPPSYGRAAEGFFEKLVRHYAGHDAAEGGGTSRAELAAVATRDEDGRVHEAESLDRLFERRLVTVVLDLEGLALRHAFELEHGSHVWTSIEGSSEIVRVRLLEGEGARDAVARQQRAARELDAALSRGDAELPPNPEALLPVVRRIAFDPPARPGESAPLEVEDYVLGHVEVLGARDVIEAVRLMRWLGATRRAT